MTATGPEAKAFRDRLERLVSRRLPTSPDAEDIVQDVFLRFIRRPEVLPEEDPPIAWLQRVVANAVTDHYRRRASEARALAQFAGEPEVGPSASASEEPAERFRRDLAECLRPMLEQLSAEDREALELTDLGSLSQREAADRLGISHSAMKSRVQRARKRLHAHLDACCHIEVDARNAPVDATLRSDRCEDGC